MSISVIQSPGALEPIYSTIPIVISGTSASLSNYRFIFDVYIISQLTAAATKIARVKLFPRSDFNCIFSPARILENQVSYDLSPYGTGFTSSQNSIVKYKVLLGEEYPVSLYWSGTTSAATGYVQLNFPAAHGLSLNDTVFVSKTDTIVNSSYNSYHTVNAITNTTAITINVLYGTSSTGETGYITSLLRMLSSPQISGKTAINFARKYKEKSIDFNSIYNLTGGTNYWLNTFTGYSSTIAIGTNEQHTLGGYCNDINYNFDSVIITTYTGTQGNFTIKGIYNTLISGLNAAYDRVDFRCGTANLASTKDTNQVGTFAYENIYDSTVTMYKIAPYDSSNGTIGEVVYFKVDSNCSIYGSKRICWLNSLGSWSYWTFNSVSSTKFEVVRTQMKKMLTYNYSVGDRGLTNLSIDKNKFMTVSTNWLLDYESEWMSNELFSSPEVFLLDGSDSSIVPLILIDKKVEVQTQMVDNLIRYTLIFQYANNDNQQRN